MHSQYSSLNHSILPLVYKVFLQGEFSKSRPYLIKSPSLKSLLLINPKPYVTMRPHISNIEKIADSRLTHIFSHTADHKAFELQNVPDGVDVYTPDEAGKFIARDLQPVIVGDLSVCYLEWKGLYEAACNVSRETVRGVVMVQTLSSINSKEILSKPDYLKSLEKIKNFPGETLVFPQTKVDKNDLQFALALDPQNMLLQSKIEMFGALTSQDKLIPSTLIQQSHSSPFFRPQFYSELLKSQNKYDNFLKVIKLSQAYRKQ